MINNSYQKRVCLLTLLPAVLLLSHVLLPLESFAQDSKRILFIYNAAENDEGARDNGSIRDEDHLYLSILEDDLGYEAVLVDQGVVSPADTADVDAIFISESVSSPTTVERFIAPTTDEGAYGNFNKPIINAEVFTWDDMLWIKSAPAPPYGVDVAWGFASSERVNILQEDHPILGGLRQGPVTVYDAPPANEDVNQVGYAVPNGDATILAATPGTVLFNGLPIARFSEMRASLFTFEEGDMIHESDSLNVTAAARRVGFFAHTRGSENLSEVGQALFANAIAWALGDEDLIQDIEADPYRVLFIYSAEENDAGTRDNGSVRDEDHSYLSILEDELGYEAVLVDQGSVRPADTTDVDAIFISESVSSGDVVDNFIAPMVEGSRYGNVHKPMVVAEIFVLDEMLWMKTGEEYPTDVAHGFATGENIDVQESDHPILGGLSSGEIDVYDEAPANEEANQVGYAVPHETGEIVAAIGSDATFNDEPLPAFEETRAALFTYEVGDSLIISDTLNFVAPARRATFFAHTRGSENLNDVGQDLFANTMLWVTGRDSEVRPIDPTGTTTEPLEELPNSFAIESVYPNPFNPSATVALSIREAGPYEVKVYDVLGRLVQKHALNVATSGRQNVALDMQNKASGMYLIQVVQTLTGKTAITRAMLVK